MDEEEIKKLMRHVDIITTISIAGGIKLSSLAFYFLDKIRTSEKIKSKVSLNSMN